MKKSDLFNETAKNCWPGYRKTGTKPGTGKNKGKQVNDCEKIEEMIPKSSFAGTKKNKLGKEAHLTNKMKRPAKPGDLVGGVSEAQGDMKGVLWRVEQSEATGKFFVVKGYNQHRKIWKNKLGVGDFNQKQSAEAKASELNKSMTESVYNRKTGFPTVYEPKQNVDLHMNEMQSNKLHVKKLLSEEEVIDHVRLHTKNLALDNVPRTHRNIYPTICSTNFALSRSSINESEHISAGKKLISMLQKLDQFPKLNIKLGSKVAIINYQLQGDWCELWGFTTPKTITKILRDNDDAITRFEFNNDSNDYWPRTEQAEYNGNFITNTSFFADKNSAEKAVSLTMLRFSDVLTIKNAIKENKERMTENNSEYDDEAGMAENNLETLKRAVEGIDDLINPGDNLPEWCQEKIAVAKSMLVSVWDYMKSEENSDEHVNETAAWKRKEGKNKNGGLNAKGVASYRRENPGSKLQTAVTTKPSKLDPDSKAAKRRKSFCARMGGMEGPMKDEKGDPTRKALALKKWNC